MAKQKRVLLVCKKCKRQKFEDDDAWIELDKNLEYYLNNQVKESKAERKEVLCEDCLE